MPQMGPIYWLMMYLVFFIFMYLFFINVWYFMNKLVVVKEKDMKLISKSYLNKW